MGTTNLFVELVVIGVGAFTWVVLLILALFGWGWVPRGGIEEIAVLIPAISVVYLLGILTDRLADAVFERVFTPTVRRPYFATPEAYYATRNTILPREPFLSVLVEYGRSRMRICRGWTFNALLLIVAFNVFLAEQITWSPTAARVQLVGNLALALLAGICWFSWRRLMQSEYSKLADAQSRSPSSVT